jgi:hypothetical protein
MRDDPLLVDLVCGAIAEGFCRTEGDLRELLRELERLIAKDMQRPPTRARPTKAVVLGGFPKF